MLKQAVLDQLRPRRPGWALFGGIALAAPEVLGQPIVLEDESADEVQVRNYPAVDHELGADPVVRAEYPELAFIGDLLADRAAFP